MSEKAKTEGVLKNRKSFEISLSGHGGRGCWEHWGWADTLEEARQLAAYAAGTKTCAAIDGPSGYFEIVGTRY